MEGSRAREIMKSSRTVRVFYEGVPVWIEKVKDGNTAEITRLDSNSRLDVPLHKLVESSII